MRTLTRAMVASVGPVQAVITEAIDKLSRVTLDPSDWWYTWELLDEARGIVGTNSRALIVGWARGNLVEASERMTRFGCDDGRVLLDRAVCMFDNLLAQLGD